MQSENNRYLVAPHCLQNQTLIAFMIAPTAGSARPQAEMKVDGNILVREIKHVSATGLAGRCYNLYLQHRASSVPTLQDCSYEKVLATRTRWDSKLGRLPFQSQPIEASSQAPGGAASKTHGLAPDSLVWRSNVHGWKSCTKAPSIPHQALCST